MNSALFCGFPYENNDVFPKPLFRKAIYSHVAGQQNWAGPLRKQFLLFLGFVQRFWRKLAGDLALNNVFLGEFSVVSVSQETKHEMSSKNLGEIRKFGANIRDDNSKKSGTFVL